MRHLINRHLTELGWQNKSWEIHILEHGAVFRKTNSLAPEQPRGAHSGISLCANREMSPGFIVPLENNNKK